MGPMRAITIKVESEPAMQNYVVNAEDYLKVIILTILLVNDDVENVIHDVDSEDFESIKKDNNRYY